MSSGSGPKAALAIALKVVALTVVLFFCFAAGAALTGMSKSAKPTENSATAAAVEDPSVTAERAAKRQRQELRMIGALLAVCFLDALVIAFLVIRSRWRGWRLMVAVALVFYGAMTVMPQIEALAFLKTSSRFAYRMLGMGAVIALPGAVAAVFLLGRKAVTVSAEAAPVVPWSIWLWKAAVAIAAYVVLYIVFGYFIAWQSADVRRAYGGGAAPTGFFAFMTSNWEVMRWLIPLQAGRGFLWVLLALPIVAMLRGAWETALAIGLAFAVLMNAQLLLPNPFMSESVRTVHMVETGASNFVFGCFVGLLFHRRYPRRT